MTVRTILSAALPLLLAAPVALAQDTPPPTPRTEYRDLRGVASPELLATRFANRFGLSDDQKVRVQAMYEQQQARFRPQFEALRNDQNLTAEQRRERAQALDAQQRTFTESALRGILTPDQFTQYQQTRPQARPGQTGQGPMGRGQTGPDADRRMHGQRMEQRGERMQQRGRQVERRGEQMQRGQRGADRLGLNDQQKQQMQALAQQHRAAVQALAEERLTVEERRTRMQALRQQFQERRQAVLTPAQRQQVEEMRQQMQQRRTRTPRTQGPNTGR